MTSWDTASARNRKDPLWRQAHGFDSIMTEDEVLASVRTYVPVEENRD